jgi:hypothetical protein
MPKGDKITAILLLAFTAVLQKIGLENCLLDLPPYYD